MKNTLPMKLRFLSSIYGLLMTKPVRWASVVVAGVITSSLILFVLAPIMVLICVGGSVWFLYMSVFDHAGIKRLGERAEARRLRQGDTDDELRD